MSASTDRKQRQQAIAAGTDKKTLAAQETAKKQAQSKLRWTLGTIAVIVLIAAVILLDSPLMIKSTTALKVGDVKLSPAEVNYYYGNEYVNFVNSYGSYASIFGLDTSNGISGLKDQDCSMIENGTWHDYFLEAAEHDAAQIIALNQYAADNGITLTDEELADVEASFEGLDETAKAQGYAGADALLAVNYGKGVTLKLAKEAARQSVLAGKAYNSAVDEFVFTPEEIAQYYEDFNGSHDYFDFLVYDVKASVEEGEESASETALMEARATADAISAAYLDGSDIEDITERFETAVESQTESLPSNRSKVQGSSLSADYSAWLMGERKAGDVTVVADSDNSGSSVVVFLGRDDNHYNTVSVRHILVKAEADENGVYTDEAKAAAKAKAEEILAEYQAGDKTEESFAALAEQYSEDAGSNTNGGLYENVPKGRMVAEFDAFCFAGHKSGDTAIVYGESASYAGYHVVYFVGEGELYSNVIAENELRSESASTWLEELMLPYEPVETFWIRWVG